MYKNAAFQGAGVKSIAYIGALKKFEEYNFKFKTVAGVSGGSIVAALYAAGYTAEEMESIFDFIRRKWLDFGKTVGWFPTQLSWDLFSSLFSLAPQDSQTMKGTIIQAENTDNIPPGYLPNAILFWYNLGVNEKFQSVSLESLKILPTLYSRLEECQKNQEK